MTTVEMYKLIDQLKDKTVGNLALLNSLYNQQNVYLEHKLCKEAMQVQNEIDLLIKNPIQLKKDKR